MKDVIYRRDIERLNATKRTVVIFDANGHWFKGLSSVREVKKRQRPKS
jgi:hypothetical protein